jgi:hypothetical protein
MRLRHRISSLEVRHRTLAAYPIYAVFSKGGGVERIRLSDGSTRTGQDAIVTCRQLPRSVPLKVYVGFDPDIMWKPQPLDPRVTRKGEP